MGINQCHGYLEDKYINCRVIGRGSYSIVYLVKRIADNKLFALKVPLSVDKNCFNEERFLIEMTGKSKYLVQLEESN